MFPVVMRVLQSAGRLERVLAHCALASGRQWRQIHGRRAVGDPGGQSFADGRRDGQSADATAAGHIEPVNALHRSDRVFTIGRHGRQSAAMHAQPDLVRHALEYRQLLANRIGETAQHAEIERQVGDIEPRR